MYRGTTPTLTFNIPFDTADITDLHIAFAQKKEVVLEKGLEDCVLNENTITVTLTEDDTLALTQNQNVEIQIRCACNGTIMASTIMTTVVNRILKEGRLNDI